MPQDKIVCFYNKEREDTFVVFPSYATLANIETWIAGYRGQASDTPSIRGLTWYLQARGITANILQVSHNIEFI